MSLTLQDLQKIDSLLAAFEVRMDRRIEKRLNQQTKKIAEVINQLAVAIDTRVIPLEKRVSKLELAIH